MISAVNPKNGRAAPMISKETYEAIMDNREVLDSAIIYDRDFAYNYVSRTCYLFHRSLLIFGRSSVRLQDARTIIPAPNRWQDRRTTSTHDHASRRRYSRPRRRKGPRDVQPHVGAILHPRLAHLVQRRYSSPSIVILLLGRHEGRLD